MLSRCTTAAAGPGPRSQPVTLLKFYTPATFAGMSYPGRTGADNTHNINNVNRFLYRAAAAILSSELTTNILKKMIIKKTITGEKSKPPQTAGTRLRT